MLLISIDLHTFVVDQECLIAHTTLAIMPEQKVANKRLLLSQPGRLALRPLGGRLGRSRFLSTRLQCVVVVVIVDASASAAAAVAAAAAAVAAAASGGSCGGCGAGFLPGGVAFEDFLPCPRWGRRCRTFRIGEERDVLDEEVPEERVPRGIRKVFQDMTQLGT